MASKLTVEDFGSFSLAFVFSALFISIFDYGLNLKSLTLSGGKTSDVRKTLSSMVFVKTSITILCIICFLIFLKFSSYTVYTKKVILILGLSAIPVSFGNFYLNSFKILNDFKKEAIGYFIQAACLIVFIIINEFYGNNTAIYFAVIITLARLLYLLYALLIYNKQFQLSINFSVKEAYIIAKKATPFAVHFILSSFIIYIDTFILSFLSNLENVGIYQAGMRIIMAAMLISVIVSDAFIPEVSSLRKNADVVKVKMNKLFEFVLLFATLVALFVFFFKNTIIQLLFSDSYLVLNSFIFYIISIIFLRYIGIVPGIILTSFNKQNVRANAVVISVIASILLNIILIPILGIKGAFLSSLIAHIILNIVYVYKSFRIIRFVKFSKNYFFIFGSFLGIYIILEKFFIDNLSSLIISLLLNLIIIVIYSRFAKLKQYLKSNNKT